MRFALCLSAAAAALCASAWAASQTASQTAAVPDAPAPLPAPPRPGRITVLPSRLPEKPSLPPAFSISVEPLSFSAPGPLYLGQRNSLVSLDFLDENRLLFTFRVPGLMRREFAENDAGEERQIRAVVLSLPAGAVLAEALWTVHDRARYLWMLKDGHFLLRDRENLGLGDASLELKPLLRFPGPVTWLEMDPAGDYLVADSREPAAVTPKPGEVPSPATASASITVDGQKAAPQAETVVRILRRESGKVMLVSRVRSSVHLPINSSGYLESLRASGTQWVVNLNYFSGGSKVLGRVESACSPLLEFLSDRSVLSTGCFSDGQGRLTALSADGRRLWEARTGDTAVWPLIVRSPDGSHLAREALAVSHPVSPRAPIDREDIKGQLVEVIDAANGAVALETTASPALDAGGNVAFSPSGHRVAVLNGGAIQVFELPPSAALPDPLPAQPLP